MNRYLVDTRVWLWLQSETDRISEELLTQLSDPGNELLLSAASSWEIAIKFRLGRLPLPSPPSAYVLTACDGPARPRSGSSTRTLRVAELPDHHNDPFDRLLVAQAQILDLPIVTADAQIAAYDVDVIDV